jgi:hypothetical protein
VEQAIHLKFPQILNMVSELGLGRQIFDPTGRRALLTGCELDDELGVCCGFGQLWAAHIGASVELWVAHVLELQLLRWLQRRRW